MGMAVICSQTGNVIPWGRAMMKTWTIRIAAAFAMAIASAARAQNILTPSSQPQLTADDLVFARLHTLVLVNFRHTPLNKAITALANAAGVNVFVDWRSLAQNAIRRRTPVTLRLKGPVAARTVLSFIRTQLSPGGQRLAFTASHGVLFLGTLQEVEMRRVTRVYTPLAGQQGQLGSGSYNLQRQKLYRIVRLLENNIDRNRWICNGGIDASATIFRGTLVVTADEAMQRKVEMLLRQMAEAVAMTRSTDQR